MAAIFTIFFINSQFYFQRYKLFLKFALGNINIYSYETYFYSSFGTLPIATTSAQWLDALKKVATEVIDQATDGRLTELTIVGSTKTST